MEAVAEVAAVDVEDELLVDKAAEALAVEREEGVVDTTISILAVAAVNPTAEETRHKTSSHKI
jgi:hypothetical protein